MEFRKSHIMGLPLTIAGVRKNRCRPFSRRVCRRCMILPQRGGSARDREYRFKMFSGRIKEVYKSNCDKRRWYPAEFSCKLWLEMGSVQHKKRGFLHSSDISRIDMVIRWGGMRRLSGFFAGAVGLRRLLCGRKIVLIMKNRIFTSHGLV